MCGAINVTDLLRRRKGGSHAVQLADKVRGGRGVASVAGAGRAPPAEHAGGWPGRPQGTPRATDAAKKG